MATRPRPVGYSHYEIKGHHVLGWWEYFETHSRPFRGRSFKIVASGNSEEEAWADWERKADEAERQRKAQEQVEVEAALQELQASKEAPKESPKRSWLRRLLGNP